MKSYRTKFKGYLDDVGKKMPSPGGGSAVCLVFCLGAGLMEKAMAYSFEPNNRLRKYLHSARKLRGKVYPYIDLDGEVFERIMQSKGPQKKKHIERSQRIIIDTARSSLKLFRLAKRVEFSIKKSIISDFYLGARCLELALGGCVLNLEANRRIFGIKSKYTGIFKRHLKSWQRY
ncbi:MAG: cyclodeaminase/cyclohydrolase family protein [Candidatus Omnitrophota bacterium]|nr:MAG: cyclodeaminase/cyclohydrolase family protein [Candidatus Omnitrophota bacterium]